MTVADNTSRNQYTATSGQTVFAYTFEIVDKDHVVVLKNGVALSEGTDYSVSNVGNDNGGNVTLTSGATAGDIMTLYRDMPYSRTQNYTNSGDFLASEVNSDFDELWLAGEQTDRAFSQSIRKPITDSDSISMELPEAATRANKFVKFDATGAVDVAGATITVSAEDVSIDDAGNYYSSGNVEGALQEVGADLTANTAKLNTIETGADVTDTANVTAAGAVMDSELTNEAAVKALNQGVATTDSPTFTGATLGAVTYTGTDGADGQVLMTNGAGVAAFEDMPSSTYLDVTDFGATGDGSDQTTALQNAINHASTRGIQTIFFPDGHYKYTTLRFYHDQTDNTAFQGTNLYVGDGTTDDFNFGWYIADDSDLTVTVEGVKQTLNTHYTVSGVGSDTGGTVTFTEGNIPSAPAGSTVTTRSGSIVGGVATREFFYSGTVIPDASNVSVTVGGVASTAFTVDIGKRLVVFNVGSEPPVGTDNVVITIQKTVNISSNNRDGRVQLRGTGRLAIADLTGLDKNRTRLYGSVLESTGDGIIIDTDQEFSTPTDARNFVAKDLTFLADNTGQIIKAEKNPGMSFDTCSFKQFNPAGTGLEVRNCWFFTLNQCYVVGQRYTDSKQGIDEDGNVVTSYPYTFDNPSATSDILVQLNGGALTETTDYTVTMGTTKTVTLTQTGIGKINAAVALSGNKTIDVQRINTGDGISSQFVGRSFGNFAGLWTITQSLVDSFGNGVHWTGGSVTNFSIRDSAIQNCGNYNIYADAGVIQQMLLDNVYMENQKTQGVSFIKGNGSGISSASIRTLKMTNCFFLGGGTNPRITGPCIDLDSVEDISIEGMYVFRPRQTFLNVTDTKNSQNIAGEIKNSVFTSDSGQTKFLDLEPTVYLLSGILPNVHNCVWPGFEDGFYNTTNNVLLFNSTVESNFLRQYTDFKGTTGTAKFGFGDTKVITVPEGSNTFTPATPEDEFTYTFDSPDSQNRIIVGRKLSGETSFTETFDFTVDLSTKLVTLDTVTAAGEEVKISTGNPYNITGSDSRTYYDLTHSMAGGLAVFLPDTGEANDGRLIIVKNNEATNSGYPYILVRNNSDQSTVIAQLSPGQAGLFIMDKQDGNKFKYTGRTFTNDLEIADNHKISFGRSDDLQIFHQSSDSTNRLVSGAANFVLPTADGTAGQSIITDGSGNLAFGTAAGTGITAVVQDTTPQLGGDLDLNGSDITGTGNIDVTGNVAVSGTGSRRIDISNTSLADTGEMASLQWDGNADLTIQGRASDGAFKANWYRIEADASDGRADAHRFYTDSSAERMSITSTGINVTGNMIVDAGVNGTIDFGNVGSAYGRLYADNTGTYVGSYTNHPLILRTNNTQRMALDTSGNLLVGPSGSPVVEVDVAGEDLKVIGTAPGLELVESDNGGSRVRYAVNNSALFQSLYGADTSTFGSTTVQTRKSDGSDNQVIYTYDGGANDYHWWGTRVGGDRLVQIDSSGKFRVRGGDVSFFDDDVESEAFFWDASESRLGLGTTSPDRQLSVNSFSGNGTVSINASTTGASTLYFADGNTGTSIYTGFIQYNHSTDTMQFATNGGTERMRITSAGDVEIRSGGELIANRADNARNIKLFNDNDFGTIQTSNDPIKIASQAYTRFDVGGTERMRITSAGNVGIGTDNPADNGLHIEKSGTARLRLTQAGVRSWDMEATGGDWRLNNASNSIVAIQVDSSGNFMVGQTSPSIAYEGAYILNDGRVGISAESTTPLIVNRKTSHGSVIEIRKDQVVVGNLGSNNNDPYIARAGGNGFRWYSGAVVPTNDSGATADNVMDLGSSIGRFDDIYATNSTIQTSDRNEKQDIEELSDAEQRVAVACKGLLRKFRWKSSVEEKGDDARIHFGIIAQDLQDAFTAEGLDAGRYGMFINSTWTDEETGEERSRMGVRYSELLAFIISAI